MIAPLAKSIDWYILQFWWALRLGKLSRLNLTPETSKLEQAVQFLNGPDFIPAEIRAAQLEFYGQTNFKFPTAEPSDYPENNTVYGHLYRCRSAAVSQTSRSNARTDSEDCARPGRSNVNNQAATVSSTAPQPSWDRQGQCGSHRPAGESEPWQQRPTIILLHGGGDFYNYRYRYPWIARTCNRAGFNVAILAAPFHFQRRPPSLPGWNYLQTAKAFSQAVADIRALTGWLLDHGCPSVALWGFSLGGWHAGLAACHDARFGAVVLSAPGVRFNFKFAKAERVIWRRARQVLRSQSAAREALDQTPLNLTRLRPRIPNESILVLEGKYDLFVEPRAVEDLWNSWQQPEIWRLPHSHVTWMFAPGLTRRVLHWLSSHHPLIH